MPRTLLDVEVVMTRVHQCSDSSDSGGVVADSTAVQRNFRKVENGFYVLPECIPADWRIGKLDFAICCANWALVKITRKVYVNQI